MTHTGFYYLLTEIQPCTETRTTFLKYILVIIPIYFLLMTIKRQDDKTIYKYVKEKYVKRKRKSCLSLD